MSVGKGDVCEATGKYEITTTMINEICPICGNSESKVSTRGLSLLPVVESAWALPVLLPVALTLEAAPFAAHARLWC